MKGLKEVWERGVVKTPATAKKKKTGISRFTLLPKESPYLIFTSNIKTPYKFIWALWKQVSTGERVRILENHVLVNSLYTHFAAIALITPLTTHPHTQVKLVRSPVRGQEQEQPDVVLS